MWSVWVGVGSVNWLHPQELCPQGQCATGNGEGTCLSGPGTQTSCQHAQTFAETPMVQPWVGYLRTVKCYCRCVTWCRVSWGNTPSVGLHWVWGELVNHHAYIPQGLTNILETDLEKTGYNIGGSMRGPTTPMKRDQRLRQQCEKDRAIGMLHKQQSILIEHLKQFPNKIRQGKT